MPPAPPQQSPSTSSSSSPLPIVPKSTHTSAPSLQPFLTATFDPTAYLNAHLPPLAIPTLSQPIIPSKHSTLSDLSSQTQSQLAQLSALSARLTDTLTTLTDEILRSGARLAYDVELLRGEASALGSSLFDTLAPEISYFVADGLCAASPETAADRTSPPPPPGTGQPAPASTNGAMPETEPRAPAAAPPEPASLTRLRTLHHIRHRLTAVTHAFDRALSWPLPPSATASTASHLISISAPSSAADPTLSIPSGPVSAEEKDAEARGQAAQERIRGEVMDMLGRGGGQGVLDAERRVEELRELCGVWRGTGEERARVRFVEGLAKVVADRRREEEGKGGLRPNRHGLGDGEGEGKGGVGQKHGFENGKERAKGLLGGLKRLREEIYLE